MKISELILQLQTLQSQHGDIQVVKRDCEWGLEVDFNIKTEKVFMQNGHLSSLDEASIAERRETAAMVLPSEEELRHQYEEEKAMMADADFEYTTTFEEFSMNIGAIAPDAQATVDLYDAAPLMVLI